MRDPNSAAVLRQEDARLHPLQSAAAQRVGALLLEDGGDEAPTMDASAGATTRAALATLASCGIFLLIARTDFHAADATGFLATPTVGASGSREVPTEDPRMRLNSKFGAMAGAVALSVGGQAVAQNAVQWRVQDGGNGHWYQLVLDGHPSWTQAKSQAEQRGGYLATLTSEAENDFARQLPSGLSAMMLGGFQDLASPNYSEPAGGWRWVTDEPWNFTNWGAGEPNNASNGHGDPGEDYLYSWTGFQGFKWGDGDNICPECNPIPYLIEWSADCNNDGLIDYGQILAGELADANHNNIPDCCEQGAPCGCPADIARDGVVNGIDLAAVLNNWGTTGGAINADVNHDGFVNGSDLAIVLNSWGPCP